MEVGRRQEAESAARSYYWEAFNYSRTLAVRPSAILGDCKATQRACCSLGHSDLSEQTDPCPSHLLTWSHQTAV